MKIANLKTESNVYALFGDTMTMVCDLLEESIKEIPGNRGSAGIFELWAHPRHKLVLEPVKQIEFETFNQYSKRGRQPDEYDVLLPGLLNHSCHSYLEKAILTATTATCEFFPTQSVKRLLMPLDNREKAMFPLTTGYYVFNPPDATLSGPLVVVLRTNSGSFYAGFMPDVFDYTSMQNMYNFGVCLMVSLANILCAFTPEKDAMMNLGVAELLDVPDKRPDAFRPNPDSFLIPFDKRYRFFQTVRKKDKNLTPEFLKAVDQRRMRILEQSGAMSGLLKTTDY